MTKGWVKTRWLGITVWRPKRKPSEERTVASARARTSGGIITGSDRVIIAALAAVGRQRASAIAARVPTTVEMAPTLSVTIRLFSSADQKFGSASSLPYHLKVRPSIGRVA